jgi:hypothetical protein
MAEEWGNVPPNPPPGGPFYGGSFEERRARDLVQAQLGSDPYQLIEQIREAGKRWAAAIGVESELDHRRKIVLAQISSAYADQIEARGERVVESAVERLARADEQYHKHIRKWAAAQVELKIAESEYWALRSELEWDRAAIAHYNALARIEE